MAEQAGRVYLVGAGPGDPGLLTRRGEALLRTADVVIYDRLVARALLELCRPDADLIYVGKESGRHAATQDEINRLLVEHGCAGRRVVRLKGGDPFVFGRGGEEALAARAAGLLFEVVPGVSSAIAVPAYAGIPVTHRGLASSVTVVTAHEDPTKPESALDWGAIAHGGDTLVFLMGVEQLANISDRLQAAGRSADEPAALVRAGTLPEQETLRGTLGSISEQARERGLTPPAVLVVGRVASLAQDLAWYENRPLRGRSVLVTRASGQASALSQRLADLGARPLEYPTIRIEPLLDSAELDAVLARLPEFDWVILTSANGVEAAFERLAAGGRDARAFGRARIAAIGPATAGALAARGILADFVPTAYTSEAIAAELGPIIEQGESVLLLRADIAPAALAKGLAEHGAVITNVSAYRTVPDLAKRDEMRGLLERAEIDVVTLTSSSTVRNLLDGLNGERGLLERPLIACIGPVTARTARELGLRVDLTASVHTVEGLASALVEVLVGTTRPIEVVS